MDEVAVFMGYSFVETLMGYSSLKPLQGESVSSVIEGKDVFAILLTGYGKSFALCPYLWFLINLKLKTLHTKRKDRDLGLHLYSVSVTVLS